MPYTDFHYTPTGTGVISGKEVLEQTEDAINDLGGQISGDVQTAIDTANNALNTANTASADAQNAVNTANTAYTTATNAQNTANAAQNTASTALTAAQNAQNDVNALGNRVTTAENNISQNTSDISGLTTRMGTAEGNITNLQNDVVTAQGTATSAQNTATLARGQAYVVRYASVAVSDNSTVPYTDLNNTDNIKANDLLLDTNGKLYQISSVDTANETVSVTTPLTQLAVDSDVVHKSGNETVAGNKTFSYNLTIYNSDNTVTPKGLIIRNAQWSMGESGATTVSNINFLDKNSTIAASVMASKGLYGQSFLRFGVRTKDSQNTTYAEEIYYDIDTSGNVEFRPWHDNIISLGTSTYRWKDFYTNKINGLEPSSLSLPSDRSARIDISGYFTNTANGDTNTYTVPANGWIYLNLNDVVVAHCFAQTTSNLSHYGQTFARASAGQLHCLFPVRKDDVFVSQWYTTTTVTVTNAYFVPCLGNI